MTTSPNAPSLSLGKSIWHGFAGFTCVSLLAFSVWAFAGGWFYRTVGELGLYIVTALVFVGTTGLFLHPLLRGSNRLGRFYKIFIPAFLAYAAAWCAAWFAMGGGVGEWVGSFVGSLVFSAIIGRALGNLRPLLIVVLVVFVLHSLGYFLGGVLMHWLMSPDGKPLLEPLGKWMASRLTMLSWGLMYGQGFGAAIGYAFWKFQSPRTGI